MPITPFRIGFEALREMAAGTVSDRLPIVLFEDRAESPDFTRAYLHEDFMSVYVARRGSGLHFVDEAPFEVQAGDVYAMGAGMSHRFEDSNRLALDAIHFVPSIFSSEIRAALSSIEGLAPWFLGYDEAESSRWLRLNPKDHLEAGEMLSVMRKEWEFDAPDRALMVQATFLRLLVFLARRQRLVQRLDSPVASRARALIELRYAEPLRIGDLAASAFLSVGRFTEVFRTEVGCSPREYLGHVRIQAAKRLLLETDLPVAAIAVSTGFPDPAYFTRFFRQQLGRCPSEFRKEQTFVPPPITPSRAEDEAFAPSGCF